MSDREVWLRVRVEERHGGKDVWLPGSPGEYLGHILNDSTHEIRDCDNPNAVNAVAGGPADSSDAVRELAGRGYSADDILKLRREGLL